MKSCQYTKRYILYAGSYPNMRLDLWPPCWRYLWPIQSVQRHPPRIPSHIGIIHRSCKLRLPLLHERLHTLGVIRRPKQLIDYPTIQQMLTFRTSHIPIHQLLHQIRTHATCVPHHVLGHLKRPWQHLLGLLTRLCKQTTPDLVASKIRATCRDCLHRATMPNQPGQEE